jgi:ABC-type branched-subunit amino acid transport system substrate-binding protein
LGLLGAQASLAADAEVPPAATAAGPTSVTAADLPYVYTQWRHFTAKEGLPSEHVFAVKADGPRVWIGTEDGLACLDKRSGTMRSWREKDGLPWRAVTALDVDKKTGDVWLGLFGGGVARFTGGRFDHFNQLNSGLANDVVYGIAVQDDNIWAATTAGASRYNTITGQWTIFTEKNAPMEEIWNYGASYDKQSGKVYLAVWGGGVLEFDVASERWKPYLDPDHEMEIDLYRDDGLVHVITTAASKVDGAMWVSTYFGNCRYDGRHWRGYYAFETGFPSDFTNFVRARSANEAWFATDKGMGVVADFPTDTVVSYTRDPQTLRGRAVVYRAGKVLESVDMPRAAPHNYILGVDIDGPDVWVATSKGLGWAIGSGYYAGLRRRAAWSCGAGVSPAAANAGETAAPQSTRPVRPLGPVPAKAGEAPAPQTAGPAGRPQRLPPELSAETANVLREIDTLNPYQTPNLPLKTAEKYAHIAKELAPFHHLKPYKEFFLTQMEYTGPGRTVPEPDDVKSVKIGFIGPIKPTVSVATGGRSHEENLGSKMLQGAQLAVEEANAKGGYLRRKIPFELAVHNDNGLWGSSGNEIINMAYKDKVWAILGSIDGANSHIAIRVALKAEILVMNSADTDPTYIETNIPWTCRVINDDRQMNYLLVEYLYRKRGFNRVGIIRASNRYGRFGVQKIVDSSRRLGHPIILEMAYPVGAKDHALQLDRLAKEELDAVVHWGDAADGAQILNEMRSRGMKQPFFACDRCVSDEFVKLAGPNAEGVICTFPWNPARKDETLRTFRKAFQQRFGDEPETYAAHAYDGMQMLIWAIQAAGLNRARIRDVIAYRTEPWKGVTGDIAFSAVLDNMGEVFLAKRAQEQWTYYTRSELGLPPTRQAPAGEPAAVTPFFDRMQRATDYAGPGREAAAPQGLAEVRIGYFGPGDPADPEGGEAWLAAGMAVAEANAAGGYQGKPFRLVAAWSQDPWKSGAARLARLVYDDQVWAVVGGIDGASTHLAEQVAVKARLTLLNPFSTDKTVNRANVPWIFSCVPGDDLLAPILADEIATRAGGKPLVIVSADGHDARVFTQELARYLAKFHVLPRLQFECKEPAADAAELASRIGRSGAESVVLAAGAADSARWVRALRDAGYQGLVFGGPAMGRSRFAREAGAAAEGVLFPLLFEPGAASAEFTANFSRCRGTPPDYAAAHAYDAVRRIVAAIRKAGLNRARIQDAVRAQSPWDGVAGAAAWDNLGGLVRTARIGTIKRGRTMPAGPGETAGLVRE